MSANRIRTVLTITIVLCMTAFTPASAAPDRGRTASDITFGLGIGSLSGYTLYNISIYDASGGIESELDFPLNTILLGLEGGYVTRNMQGRDAFRIGLQWFTNVGSGSGKMKDSDWISGTAETDSPPNGLGLPAHPGLDIYSESDIALKANIVDLRASYSYWPLEGFAIGPLGGLLYQKFQFDASNVHQVGYGLYAPGFTGSTPGLVLTYDVTYVIPYFGMHAEIAASPGFQVALDLGFTPWARAEDRDDHVLRGKLSEGSTSGNAYLATLALLWDIKDKDSFLIRGQYLKIDTSGTQTQTWYQDEVTPLGTIPAGTRESGINDRITSQQTTLYITFSHRF